MDWSGTKWTNHNNPHWRWETHDLLIPAGSRVKVPYLWGYDTDGSGLSYPHDYIIQCTIIEDMSSNIFSMVYRRYLDKLAETKHEGRFFYIEAVHEVTANNRNYYEIVWGT